MCSPGCSHSALPLPGQGCCLQHSPGLLGAAEAQRSELPGEAAPWVRGEQRSSLAWVGTMCSASSIKGLFIPHLPRTNTHLSWHPVGSAGGRAAVETPWLPSYLLFVEQLKDPYRSCSGRSVPFEEQAVAMSDSCPSAWQEGKQSSSYLANTGNLLLFQQ